jgi:hypothetical protein
MVEGAGQRRVTVVDPREAILGIEYSFWREQVREEQVSAQCASGRFPCGGRCGEPTPAGSRLQSSQ